MKIAFVGNANNYPLAVARAMRAQGHQVDFFLVNELSYSLDSPENRYAEYDNGYPDWIIDLRPLDMWWYDASLEEDNKVKFTALIKRLQEYDAFVFNQVAVFLANYVTKPVYLLLTGTDLLTFCDYNFIDFRESLYYYITDPVKKSKIRKFYSQRVEEQRIAIKKCVGFNFFPKGVVPDGDSLIDSIGVSVDKRDAYMVLDTTSIVYSPFNANDIFTATFAARLTWIRDDELNATKLDLKGVDIFIKALGILAQRGRTVRVHLFRKGAHVEQTQQFVEQVGVADWIEWHDEVTQVELLEYFKAVDVVVDNLESPAIGMVALDAMATGRPVIARVNDMSGFGVSEPPPVLSAGTPEAVADALELLMDNGALRQEYAQRGRKFVEEYFSANHAATRILEVVQGFNSPYHLQRLEYLRQCPTATKWLYRGLKLYHVVRHRQFSLLCQRFFPKPVCTLVRDELLLAPSTLANILPTIPYCPPCSATLTPLLPVATAIFTHPDQSVPLKVTHCIGTLGSGGAERQLTCVAKGQKDAGNDVAVFCVWLESDFDRHFLPELEEHSIIARIPRPEAKAQTLQLFENGSLDKRLLASIAPDIRDYVLQLTGEFIENKPDILHCWLDTTNCAGAWAGLLAGVPRIICSFRSANPSNYNETFYPGMAGWMHSAYSFFAELPSITFLANAHVVAQDYADWLAITPSQIEVVHNGLDFDRMPQPVLQDTLLLRQELGIPKGAPVVAGVFRLTEEKRPLDFINIVAKVRETIPDLHIVHAGVGAMEPEFVAEAKRLGVYSCLRMLGQRNDVPKIIGLADVFLHCAKSEGFSNVVLESCWFHTPPVTTRVGEMDCIVQDGFSGYLHDVGDIDGMVSNVKKLLLMHEIRQNFANVGYKHIHNNFSSERMVQNTTQLYLKRK